MIDQYPTPFRIDPKPSYDLITNTWFPGFSHHVLFTQLDDDEKRYAEQIILDFTGFILYYQDCTPEDWSPSVIERCLLKDFPGVLPGPRSMNTPSSVFFLPFSHTSGKNVFFRMQMIW
jgi:hypothetical protein